MSELTPCNFCRLKDITERAEARGATVDTYVEESGWIAVKVSDRDRPQTWFLALTDHCVC